MPLSDVFNLKKQLIAYGSHHNNKVNVAIHMVFVPTIFWTALVFGAKTGPLVSTAGLPKVLKDVGPNLSFFTVAGYSLYYTILDPVASLLYAPLLYGMCYSATRFEKTNPNAMKIALAGHIVAWIFQFIGHGVAEKRRPKLVDNLVQALVSAPYFVFFEVLFALGYRPSLRKQVEVEVQKDIAEFRAKQEKKAQ
ncbi:duf962 domain protein [Lichtheimia corymbifera JMRC:FSU:9682]|uniref:Duf962 domain protein n=1 Tax=Lichtheimia corymbifera JMRC:FSU:9682 TaxID=1263082 RepID=A0A068RL13_9FUNG|nr:DUF962-domain-containing protein [Lichtheimia hyalospora FSU 10163]CDH50332.1 duf962 domain protein [Lichtheimia corymbifera JMRC:FSU:9682]